MNIEPLQIVCRSDTGQKREHNEDAVGADTTLGLAVLADGMGGYSIGIREHSIFPETSDEDLKDVFGIGITVVTNLKDKLETKHFLELLGFPIKKDGAIK